MNYTICNPFLNVNVSSHGGELQSICTPDKTQYLWQGDPEYWADRAPNIFPYVARLTDGKYTYRSKTYSLDIHGFLKDSEMLCESHSDNRLVLYFEDTEETIRQYPFSFRFSICYELKGQTLHITYHIENHSDETMYFGLGGHPGFLVPLDQTLCFEDYVLQFESGCRPEQLIFTEDCFVTDAVEEFKLAADGRLALRHSLFDRDALILQNAGSEITLASDKSPHSVSVQFAGFPYLGLWHCPRTEAGYICIKPWCSLPSRKGVIEDLEQQKNLISLPLGCTCEKSWSITIR